MKIIDIANSRLLLIFPEISGNIKFTENLQPYTRQLIARRLSRLAALTTLLVLGSVSVHFLFVAVWLSVPEKSIAWKDLSLK